jgi:hypothetical protein
MINQKLISLTILLLVTTASQAAPGKRIQNSVSLNLGKYYPISKEVRTILGNSWLVYGFTPETKPIKNGLDSDLDFRLILAKNGINRVTLFTPSAGISWWRQSDNSNTKGFLTTRMGLMFVDYNLTGTSHQNIGFAANCEAGLIFGNRLRIGARYDLFTEQETFNFSGASIFAEYSLFKF